MPYGPSSTFWVQWPFTASERTILGTSGGLRFGPSQWAARLNGGGGPLPLELGARFGLLEQFRVLAHLAACTEHVARSGITLVRIEPKQFVLFDVGLVVDNVLPPFQGEKPVVFLAILAVARMVIWTTRKKGLYDDANFSYRDLILFFRHQLRVRIRCDRKHLDRITFDKRWVNAASLVVRKEAMLEPSFSPRLAHGVCGLGPSRPHPE